MDSAIQPVDMNEVRKKPTKQLVERIISNDSFVVEKVHHGISEVPMNLVYPHLNLVEALAFGAGMWDDVRREKMRRSIRNDPSDLYSVFRIAFNSGMPLIRGARDSSLRTDSLYQSVNPFSGTTFSDRIARVDEDVRTALGGALLDKATRYVFEGPFQKSPREYHDADAPIHVMRFQFSWPKKGKGKVIRDRYLGEINRIVKSWDSSYVPFVKPEVGSSPEFPHQGLLFS